jgi:multidrug resistance efflux pump
MAGHAFDTATLLVRLTGYISKRNVDIGGRVHAGAVLAVIDAPDLDRQRAQTRAHLVRTEAKERRAIQNHSCPFVCTRGY